MKEFVISEAQVETAILVGLITQTQDERKTKEYLDELEFLAETAGATVVKRFTQKLPAANSVTYVGKGKLEEIKEYIHQEEENEREVGMVIFDDELSAKQIRNIEAELKVKILKNLKHKKKYYVIVRGYKKIKKGKRYIPEFSPVNKLTITI